MVRRVTQTTLEVLGTGGTCRVHGVWVDALVQMPTEVQVWQVVMELIRTPGGTPLFLPVVMINSG